MPDPVVLAHSVTRLVDAANDCLLVFQGSAVLAGRATCTDCTVAPYQVEVQTVASRVT